MSSIGRTKRVDEILSLKLGSLLNFSKNIILLLKIRYENKYACDTYKYDDTVTSRYLSFCSFWKGGVSRGPPVRGKVRVPPAGGGRWSVWIAPPSVDIVDSLDI